ncbi:hypothetical protein F751_4279 [Auxenochlorella protothecoides]|uniref:Uncharacterized protein n=1 Tax=Auxenochlorella protothecoides TaxID=3075 RepID=A0A087SA81_AUXPR|nr:hypothetical protein F751_4279 [Auxenochlorella protothecoides]KFM22635.1 hypothetical protein F751_4279 [Auxenochlorella protothecoides]
MYASILLLQKFCYCSTQPARVQRGVQGVAALLERCREVQVGSTDLGAGCRGAVVKHSAVVIGPETPLSWTGRWRPCRPGRWAAGPAAVGCTPLHPGWGGRRTGRRPSQTGPRTP